MPVPVVVDIDVVRFPFAVALVRAVGGGALPQVPVEPRGGRGRLAVANRGAVVVVPGAGIVARADVAAVNSLDRLHDCGERAALRAELHDAVVLPSRSDGQLSFARVVARRLL